MEKVTKSPKKDIIEFDKQAKIKFNNITQEMTHILNNFKIVVDFQNFTLNAVFDFKKKRMSLVDYSKIINDLVEVNNMYSKSVVKSKTSNSK
jgi:hypothetical protein